MQAVQVTEQKSKINNCNNHQIKEMIAIEWELLTCIHCLMTQVILCIHDRIEEYLQTSVLVQWGWNFMCVDIVWLCIGSEFAVLAVIRQTEDRMLCSLIW